MHNEHITLVEVLLSEDGLHSVSEVGVEELLVGSGREDVLRKASQGRGHLKDGQILMDNRVFQARGR